MNTVLFVIVGTNNYFVYVILHFMYSIAYFTELPCVVLYSIYSITFFTVLYDIVPYFLYNIPYFTVL